MVTRTLQEAQSTPANLFGKKSVVALSTLAVTSVLWECFIIAMIAPGDRLTPFFVILCSIYTVKPQDLKAAFRFLGSGAARKRVYST